MQVPYCTSTCGIEQTLSLSSSLWSTFVGRSLAYFLLFRLVHGLVLQYITLRISGTPCRDQEPSVSR